MKNKHKEFRYRKKIAILNLCLKMSCCIIILLANNYKAKAQDFKKLIEELRKAYNQNEKLHVQMTIAAYENPTATMPYYKEKAEIKRAENNYWYSFGNNEMLLNEKYLLMIDRQSKEIILSQRDIKSEKKLKQNLTQVSIDSILHFYEEPQLLEAKNQLSHYQVVQKKGEINQIDLYIDTKENTLKKIEYQYRDHQFVRIAFTVFDKAPAFSVEDFSEKTYILITKSEIKPAKSCAGYHILNAETENEF